MKLLFSEARPEYGNYVFPYAVWAFPEAGETPADLFAAGFLPSSHQLDRFYLCRHIRVRLDRFSASSENRRILRKGQELTATLVPRAEFEFTAARREFCLQYANSKFGGGMKPDRLDSLLSSPVTSHVLVFTVAATGAEVGLVTVHLEAGLMAFYYYAFYDLAYANPGLGMFMMTSAVTLLAAQGCPLLYLGTCYAANALYKTQFAGVEFFNGVRWSDNLEELKQLLQRQQQPELTQHLLESAEYREKFLPGMLPELAAHSVFRAGGGTSAPI